MAQAVNLTANDKLELSSWIGRSILEFRLLYKASDRECSASLFHQQCDNKGPTVSLAYTSNGEVFGGYTDKNFESSADVVVTSSVNVFVFRLRKANQPSYMIYSTPNPGIVSGENYGPTFVTVERADPTGATRPTLADSKIQLQLFTAGPHYLEYESYAWPGFYSSLFDRKLNDDQRWWFQSSKFIDFEVYQVVDSPQTERPWRTITIGWTEEAKVKLKREICSYSPPQCVEVPEVQILLVGPIGAGKSSFSNSINSVFLGYPIYAAHAGEALDSVTSMYRIYSIRDDQEVKLKLHICDTMGLKARNDAGPNVGLNTGDVGPVIDGHVLDFFKFNPAVAIAPTDNSFRPNPARRDRSHVIAFVVDSSKLEIMSDSVKVKLNQIRQLANERCIPIVVLLTKIDKLSAIQSLSSIFSDRDVWNAVKKAAEKFGIPTGSILPIKNYESEGELVVEIDILLLMALQTLIRLSRSYFQDEIDRYNLQN